MHPKWWGHNTIIDPNSERVPSNPFWIYTLKFVEIKIEVDRFTTQFLQRGTSAHFMNMQITISMRTMVCFKYTNLTNEKSPIPMRSIPTILSNRSVSQSYNIIQSQAFPILYLSNNVHDLVNELDLLLQVLTTNGFRQHRLKYLLMEFLRHSSFWKCLIVWKGQSLHYICCIGVFMLILFRHYLELFALFSTFLL